MKQYCFVWSYDTTEECSFEVGGFDELVDTFLLDGQDLVAFCDFDSYAEVGHACRIGEYIVFRRPDVADAHEDAYGGAK